MPAAIHRYPFAPTPNQNQSNCTFPLAIQEALLTQKYSPKYDIVGCWLVSKRPFLWSLTLEETSSSQSLLQAWLQPLEEGGEFQSVFPSSSLRAEEKGGPNEELKVGRREGLVNAVPSPHSAWKLVGEEKECLARLRQREKSEAFGARAWHRHLGYLGVRSHQFQPQQ